jgi:hypothetical protein
MPEPEDALRGFGGSAKPVERLSLGGNIRQEYNLLVIPTPSSLRSEQSG